MPITLEISFNPYLKGVFIVFGVEEICQITFVKVKYVLQKSPKNGINI